MSHLSITVASTTSSRQLIMADQMFLAPSAGSSLRDWTEQPLFFPRCQRQYSAALCILGHHLKTPFLWKKFLLFHHSTISQQTTTASQTEILKSQRTCNHLASPGLLIKMRESQVLSLLSQLVLVNVGGFARCHEEWLSQWPKVCTTWHINLP